MGQPIEVTSRPGSRPGVVIFAVNRSLTGMQIEDYHDPAAADGPRWVDELARRLAAVGVTRVTVSMNAIVAEAPDWSELQGTVEETIRDLYVFYGDGVTVPTDEEIVAQAPPD